MAKRYIRPTPHGSGSGSSWEDATTIIDLPDKVLAAGAGGEILISDFDGPHEVTISIMATIIGGGTIDAPLKIRASKRDESPGEAIIRGYRTSPYVSNNSQTGPRGIQCSTGVDGNGTPQRAEYIEFEGLHFVNMGNGCIRSQDTDGVPLRGIKVRRCRTTNVQRFFQAETGFPMEAVEIRDCHGKGNSKFWIRGNQKNHNWIIEDCTMDGDFQFGDSFCSGIGTTGDSIENGNNNWIIRRCTFKNIYDTDASGYKNGDGIANEIGDNNWLIEDCKFIRCHDGGVDLKGTHNIIRRCTMIDCKRSARIWSHDAEAAQVIDCISINPVQPGGTGGACHFWIKYGDAVWIGGEMISKYHQGVALESDTGVTVSLDGGQDGLNIELYPAASLITHGTASLVGNISQRVGAAI